jgi:serine/threonine-protein kinase
MELRPGLVVGKNVRLVRLLGEGGMGSVWVADHLTLQTEVAIKFISSELVKDEQALKRFTSEATASAQVKSPHVVQVFDHGVWEERPYIVMELLVGEDLEGRIARAGPLSLEDTSLLIKQAAKALSQAHAIGIVHRDIKPANVFLTSPDGELFIKLLDFGIAKRLQGGNHAKTAAGALIGTPYYMSPEQIMDDREIDFRADLWALAVLAYEALTAQLPFDGASLGAICVAINACQYKPVSSFNRSLPPEIDRWFAKALARNPDDRFGSAKELADALLAIGQSAYGWDMSTARMNRVSLPSTPAWQPAPLAPPASFGPGAPHPHAAAGHAYPQQRGGVPAASPSGVLPPPAMPPGPHRSSTPLPGGMAAVSATSPPIPPARPSAPYGPPGFGVMPPTGAPLAPTVADRGRSTTPLSDVAPPGPWPAHSPSRPEMPVNPALASTPLPGTWRARTDPLPPALPPSMDVYPKQTLGGTTMTDVDPTRRKRRIAVALAGGVAVLGAIIAVIVTLTRSPAAPADGPAAPGNEVVQGTPVVPAPTEPSVAPSVPQTVTPEPDPSPSVQPASQPAPSATASTTPAGASVSPAPRPTPGAPTSTSKLPSKPKRRDHGF